MFPASNNPFSGEEHQSFHLEGGSNATLLIHGFPGTPAEVRPLADILHQSGWTVHGILLPGFGRDINNIFQQSHQDWIDFAGAELEELQQNYERVTLLGFSMGGAIAINLAKQYPVDGLILFSPFIEVEHILWKALPLIQRVLPKIKIFKLFKPDFTNPQTRNDIQNFIPDANLDDPQVQANILDFELPISVFNEIRIIGQKASRVTPELNMPTIVLQGKQDNLVKPKVTRTLVQSMKSEVVYREVNAPHEIINPELPDWSIIVNSIQQFSNQIATKD